MTFENPIDLLTTAKTPDPLPEVIAEVARLKMSPPRRFPEASAQLRKLGWKREDGTLTVPEAVMNRLKSHPEWKSSGIVVSPNNPLSITTAFCQTYVWAWERNLL